MGEEVVIIATAVMLGIGLLLWGFATYFEKVVQPALEVESKKTKQLIRSLLPGVSIHAAKSSRDIHITYSSTEYIIYGPHWKDGEDGGPRTSVFSIDAYRKCTCVWQRFHEDKEELNALYLNEALESIKKTAPNQPLQPTRFARG